MLSLQIIEKLSIRYDRATRDATSAMLDANFKIIGFSILTTKNETKEASEINAGTATSFSVSQDKQHDSCVGRNCIKNQERREVDLFPHQN